MKINNYKRSKWNSKKNYIGEYEFDDVRRTIVLTGPGAIFNNDLFLNYYDGYTLFEDICDGKIHGAYYRWDIKKKYKEFGMKKSGKNVGPCLSIKNDEEADLTTYDENQNEHGFYVKFIEKGYNFILFYFDHGKLSNRCIINQHNELYFGECSSLTNYKKISENKFLLPFYPDNMLGFFHLSNPNRPEKDRRLAEKHMENRDNDKVIGWETLDFSGQTVFACTHVSSHTYIGEISTGFSSTGCGIIIYNSSARTLGNFFQDNKDCVLSIDKNNKYSLQKYQDDKLHGYTFSDQKECFIISKYENGKLFDQVLRIEKETLNISLHRGNGQVISTCLYPKSENVSNPKVKNDKELTSKENVNLEKISSKSSTINNRYQIKEEKKEEKIIKTGWHKFDYQDGRYEGKYSNDLRSGHGTFFFKNNDKVEGTWENDKMNGYGTYYYANGDKYEGFFKNGLFHGRGTFTYKNGNKIVGTWENGQNKESLRSGREDYPNGYYIGEFLNDDRHGIGTYFFNDGSKYEGQWVHNQFTGSGKYYGKDGTIYEGYFINGQLNGSCIVYFKSGATYSGEFKNNKKNGDGRYETSDGRVYYQYWENGEQVE